MRANWNHERTELCVKLWNNGLSAGVIARRIPGVSRNAVIGKIHRLNANPSMGYVIDRKPVPRASGRDPLLCDQRRARRRTPRANGIASQPKIAEAPLPPEQPAPDKLVRFVDLDRGMCRFIFGDPRTPEHGFCGCKTAPGATYCPGHQALCTSRAEPTRRRITHIPSTNAGIVSADKALEAIQ